MYRVWARARLHFVKAWALAPGPRGGARAYWWGGVGKACDRAMWQHALRDEASQGWRLGAATVVCDGSKFYENVTLRHLLHDYPDRAPSSYPSAPS